jgi:site-specific DNA recombinase
MRRLNEQSVPTRKRLSRWERSTVWAMLRNPAYKGLACWYGWRRAPTLSVL